jgi:hypothetical protein
MSKRFLHLVRMDVAHDHEATFNEVYDKEHVPLLGAVPGVGRATRYRNPSPTDPAISPPTSWRARPCSRARRGRRRRRAAAGQRRSGLTP